MLQNSDKISSIRALGYSYYTINKFILPQFLSSLYGGKYDVRNDLKCNEAIDNIIYMPSEIWIIVLEYIYL